MASRNIITRDGYNRLLARKERIEKELLPKLREQLREEMTELGADWYERSEYEAVWEQIQALERELADIESRLKDAEIIEVEAGEAGVVGIGSQVTLLNLEENTVETLTIVGPGDIRPDGISYDSPVGKALLGKKVGDQVQVSVPAGVLTFRILALQAPGRAATEASKS